MPARQISARIEAVAAAGVIGGVIAVRYLFRLPSAVALTPEQIRRTYAPALRAALRYQR